MTWAMIGVSACVFLTPETIKLGAFRYMLTMGFDARAIYLMFGIAGWVRIFALLVNGRWPVWGPRLRALAAITGAFMWMQLSLALMAATSEQKVLFIGIPVFLALTAGEIVSCYRAGTDVAVK